MVPRRTFRHRLRKVAAEGGVCMVQGFQTIVDRNRNRFFRNFTFREECARGFLRLDLARLSWLICRYPLKGAGQC
jgi:hypothetical protein